MKFYWKKALAYGLALSICCGSASMTHAADINTPLAETETYVETDTYVETEPIVDESASASEILAVETVPEEAEVATAPAVQKVTIEAERLDEDGRYYELTLQYYNPSVEPKSISFAVWNQADGRTIWHKAEYDEAAGTYKAVVDMFQYAGSGVYTTHCYRENADGSKQYVAGKVFDVETAVNRKPTITKEAYTDTEKTTYVIEYSNIELADGEVMRAAVWSEEGGQDDLKWTNFKVDSGNKATLTISVNDYHSAGKFIVHIYRTTADGVSTFVASRNFQVEKITSKKVEVQASKNGDGTTAIRVTNLVGMKKVRVAVWSMDNQSDLHWYAASQSGNDWVVKMDLKNHKNNWKNYRIHVYATDANGVEKFVGSSSVDYTFYAKKPEVTLDKANSVIQLEVKNLQFPEKMQSVRAALWSEDGGQDDISWSALTQDANYNWKVTIPMNKLHSAGECVFHIYAAKADGTQIYVGGGRFTIEVPSIGTAKVFSDNKVGSFQITVDKVYGSVKKLEALVWCSADQSDQKTYTLTSDGNGTYSVSSNIKNHAYHVGTYQIQIYVTDAFGIRMAVQRLTMNFKNKFDALQVTETTQGVQYAIVLKNAEIPAGAKSVDFAVWSEAGGQDDLKWYKASASGADYKASVDIQNHKSIGKYIVHAYATNLNGEKSYITGSNFNVKNSVSVSSVQIANITNNGTFDVVVKNVTAASGVSKVRVAAWPTNNSTIVRWYDAVKTADGNYKVTVDVANHQYYCGSYTMHIYTTAGNGIQSFTTSHTYKYEPSNFMYVAKDQGNGKRTIGIYNPSKTENVRIAVWSDANGQDDCRWYPASKAANGSWKITIAYNEFKDSGTFHAHAYSGNTALRTLRFDFPKSEFGKNGWYYEEHYGRTYKLYYVDDVLQTDVRDIVGKQSSYKAEVNRTTCTVTIYAKDGENGYILPVCAFVCSVGLPETPTPTGTYNTLAKYRWHELMGPSWGQYCTRIVGGILFHSVAGSNMTSYNLSAAAFNKLGQPASHGCVRLCVRDAKWIYDNCSLGMTVRIYDSSYPGPLGKPEMVKIPSWQNWDPTDPAV